MKPSQADFLLRIAENTYTDGDETIEKMRQMGRDHIQRVLDDEETLKRASEVNQADKKRFAQYLPQQRPELTQGQASAVSPRPALPLRKAAE